MELERKLCIAFVRSFLFVVIISEVFTFSLLKHDVTYAIDYHLSFRCIRVEFAFAGVATAAGSGTNHKQCTNSNNVSKPCLNQGRPTHNALLSPASLIARSCYRPTARFEISLLRLSRNSPVITRRIIIAINSLADPNYVGVTASIQDYHGGWCSPKTWTL